MRVDLIQTYDAFEKLRPNWEAIYDADPDAQLFLSWIWFSPWFRRYPSRWYVLAARSDDASGDYVAIFPLRLRTRMSKRRGVFVNELDPAGLFGWADYTGFICLPDHEEQALPAFAQRLMEMHWARLNLKHFRTSARRLGLFTAPFERGSFIKEDAAEAHARKGVNNEICPFVDLPGDFETYLKEKLSANTRQKLRRLLRQMETSGELRVTLSTPETFDRDLDILIGFWKQKWAGRKAGKADYLAERYRDILRQSLEGGFGFVQVLWRGERPLGALGSFVDRRKKTMLYFVAGRDESVTNPPPGLVLHAHGIRWAIENGLRTYDFLRGNEPFKYSLGASDHRIRNIAFRTRTGTNLHGSLDPRCVDEVLEQCREFEQAGRLREAEAGYRQVLHVRPSDPASLRAYGGLLYENARYGEALRVWRRAVELEPRDAAAWRQQGKCQLGLHEYADAEAAFRSAIEIDPSVAAHYYLSRALRGQGREADAAMALRDALKLAPRGEKERKLLQRAREQLAEYEQE